MAIKKRGKRWQADITINGRRVRASAPSEEDARVLEAEIRASLLAGRPVPSVQHRNRNTSLGEIMEKVFERRWRGARSEQAAMINAREALEFFGRNKDIRQITATDIDDYVTHLGMKGNANGTINRKLASLSTILTFALDRGLINKKPKIERLKEPKGRIRFLTIEEEKMVLNTFEAWGNRPMRDFVILAIDTGLRLSEVLRLEWRDVDLNEGVIHVWETKNGYPRTVPMTQRVHSLLKLRYQEKPDEASKKGPLPKTLTRHSVRHQWDRMRGHLGFDKDGQFVVHALRHTFASRLIQKGAGLAEVQELLGHSDITTTRRYAHLAPKNLRAAVRLLDQKSGMVDNRVVD